MTWNINKEHWSIWKKEKKTLSQRGGTQQNQNKTLFKLLLFLLQVIVKNSLIKILNNHQTEIQRFKLLQSTLWSIQQSCALKTHHRMEAETQTVIWFYCCLLYTLCAWLLPLAHIQMGETNRTELDKLIINMTTFSCQIQEPVKTFYRLFKP